MNKNQLTNPPSMKVFHIIYRNGAQIVRYPFHPALHTGFNPETQFSMIYETNTQLDHIMRGYKYGYGVVTVHLTGAKELKKKAYNFLNSLALHNLVSKQTGDKYRLVWGGIRDGVATVYFTPMESKFKSLKAMGFDTKHKANELTKQTKRLVRAFAYHEWSYFGQITEKKFKMKHGDGYGVTIQGANGPVETVVQVCDLKDPIFAGDAMGVDGEGQAHIKLLHALGQTHIKVGDMFKGTCNALFGEGKGDWMAVDNIEAGIVIYGAKKEFTSKHFFMGSLGDCKPFGAAYSDALFIVHCSMYKRGILQREASAYLEEFYRATHDEEMFQAFIMHHFGSMVDALQPTEEGEELRQQWILLDAFRRGVPVIGHKGVGGTPALRRRVQRHSLEKILQLSKGRIPFNRKTTMRVWFKLDPCAYVGDGSVDMSLSVIPEGYCCCMDLPQGCRIGIWRNPTGNAMEYVVLINKHYSRFRKYLGKSVVLFGHGIMAIYGALGGADGDDNGIATIDVDIIDTLLEGVYPLTSVSADALEAADDGEEPLLDLMENNKYRNLRDNDRPADKEELVYPRQWDVQSFLAVIEQTKKPALSLGVSANRGILDFMESGAYKEHQIETLVRWIEQPDTKPRKYKHLGAEKLSEFLFKLIKRPDNMLAPIVSNFEKVVDQSKMDSGPSGMMGYFQRLIKEADDVTVVYPPSMEKRIPTKEWDESMGEMVSLVDGIDYILVPTPLCEVLAAIQHEVDQLQEALKEEEWLTVRPLESSLLDGLYPKETYGQDPYRMIAKEIKDWARKQWFDFMRQYPNTQSIPEAESDRQRKAVEAGIKAMLEGGLDKDGNPNHPPEVQRAISVARYRLANNWKWEVGKIPTLPNGRLKNYPDSDLWSPSMGHRLLEAFDEVGMSGLFVPVILDHWTSRLRDAKVIVVVNAMGEVFMKEDGSPVGTLGSSDPVPVGEYPMNYGLITVREPMFAYLEAPENLEMRQLEDTLIF